MTHKDFYTWASAQIPLLPSPVFFPPPFTEFPVSLGPPPSGLPPPPHPNPPLPLTVRPPRRHCHTVNRTDSARPLHQRQHQDVACLRSAHVNIFVFVCVCLEGPVEVYLENASVRGREGWGPGLGRGEKKIFFGRRYSRQKSYKLCVFIHSIQVAVNVWPYSH